MDCVNCLFVKSNARALDSLRRVETIHPNFRLVALWLFLVTIIAAVSNYIFPIMGDSVLFLKTFGLFSIVLFGVDILFTIIDPPRATMVNPSPVKHYPKTSEILILLIWSIVVAALGLLGEYGQIGSLSFILAILIFVFSIVRDLVY